MEFVSSFANRFYGIGFAAGCGGCIIFVVIIVISVLIFVLYMSVLVVCLASLPI